MGLVQELCSAAFALKEFGQKQQFSKLRSILEIDKILGSKLKEILQGNLRFVTGYRLELIWDEQNEGFDEILGLDLGFFWIEKN